MFLSLCNLVSEHLLTLIHSVLSFKAYTILQIGCALAQNKTTLLVCRFLAGTFAACPLTNAGGIITGETCTPAVPAHTCCRII